MWKRPKTSKTIALYVKYPISITQIQIYPNRYRGLETKLQTHHAVYGIINRMSGNTETKNNNKSLKFTAANIGYYLTDPDKEFTEKKD